MPKKTKKEKILAEYRKKIRLLNQLQTSSFSLDNKYQEEKAIPKKTVIKKSEKLLTDKKNNIKDNKDCEFLIFFRNDLIKSLLIISFIIALEFVLYFAKLIR